MLNESKYDIIVTVVIVPSIEQVLIQENVNIIQIRLNSYRGDCTKSIEQVLIQDNVK